ncbi:hypothetical protein BU16DRAFT_390743 [Lophium mytilinum]|uniref:Uncharacterized protein n=1 Tax=Lophium mytilinum TaxID=390894 RepID=A0A6A6QTN5_9PEZI|nr:hypothetical protein BU16DRAFT_390743 [Lophium mytilinum]
MRPFRAFDSFQTRENNVMNQAVRDGHEGNEPRTGFFAFLTFFAGFFSSSSSSSSSSSESHALASYIPNFTSPFLLECPQYLKTAPKISKHPAQYRIRGAYHGRN